MMLDMKNLKWCVISEHKTVSDLTICESKERAVKQAQNEWNRLSAHDKRNSRVIAGTCNIGLDPHYGTLGHAYLEDGNIDADIYDIAWDSKEG